MVQVLGIDGYSKGWIAILLDDGRFSRAVVGNSLNGMVGQFSDAACIGVDMPVGLVEAGSRDADLAARSFLSGHRKSSVFPTPPYPATQESSYESAAATARRVNDGKGLSKQAYALIPKIIEVDTVAARDDRIHEVHPEVSFKVLAGRDLKFPKKTWSGQNDRRNLLAAAGIVIPDDLGETSEVPADDVLDAAIVAWSAQRIASGQACSFPSEPTQLSSFGRPIAIWA